MASGPTLPPQAYTREILTAAFTWLQSQPESVRKLATTPDALVGLYTRAKRFGNSSLEADAPVSSQNFMSDLKHLAEGLKQFEDPKGGGASPSSGPLFGPVASTNSTPNGAHSNSAVNQSPLSGGAALGPHGLNDRSRAMIQEVRNHLNLSSDTEAINMMLALAYKSLKNLLS